VNWDKAKENLNLSPGEKLQAVPPMYTTLIDPPYELAPNKVSPLVVTALQLKHAASRMLTLKPLAIVAPQMLLVLLPAVLLKLHAYPPMYTTLIDPPYEFARPEKRMLVVIALQLKHDASRMITLKPLANVAPHLLLVLLLSRVLKLHAYPPICATLIDPPYEFAPLESNPFFVTALQWEQAAPMTLTLNLLALVVSHLLTVLLVAKLKLSE
jgi:hypothetical protein